MNRFLTLAFCSVITTALLSCGNKGNSDVLADNGMSGDLNQVEDSTLCQFNNIKLNKMFSYCDEEGDTTYFDNIITALWPQIINGKPCTELQQALLRAMTDSAALDQFELAANYLLNPCSYSDCDSSRLAPVTSINCEDGKLSTSEVNVIMESMTDRLLTYDLGTYAYRAGGAHGIYAHNYVTYDLKTLKAVTLNDIIADTTLLRTATLKSIKDTYNYGKDDLFLPENGLLPLPGDFLIKDNVLHVVYQVYEIASYAQGLIDAPIYPYLLKPEEMKRLFTPYGLELINYTD